MNTNLISLVGILIFFLIAGCKGDQNPSPFDSKHSIEVAPDKWLEMDWHANSRKCNVVWKEKEVVWTKKRDELFLSLREKNDILYLIGLDISDVLRAKFIFFQLNATGNGFVRIEASKYPRDIATQNMGLSDLEGGRDAEGNPIDCLKMLRELDVSNKYFAHMVTAKIWASLETGKDYDELSKLFSYEETQKICEDYVKKHKPVPLKNITKKPAKASEK